MEVEVTVEVTGIILGLVRVVFDGGSGGSDNDDKGVEEEWGTRPEAESSSQ